MPTFEASVTLSCRPEDVFDFLVRPANIKRISHPDVGISFINPPEVLQLGTRFEFQIQAYGQVRQIMHEVILLERPRQYTEKQIEGPLRHWVHQHIFEQTGTEEVNVIDRIEFEPPGGLVGLLVTESKILEGLEEGFFHTHAQLKQLMEQAGG